MALVKCPECGKDNVSDSANSCPSCGYDLKSHFERVRNDELKLKQEEELQRSLQAKRDEIWDKIQPPDVPKKTTFEKILPLGCFALTVPFILLIILAICSEEQGVLTEVDVALILCMIIGLVLLGIYSWIKADDALEIRQKDYALAKKDFDEYKEEMMNRELKRQESENLERSSRKLGQNNVPICPVCRCHNTRRISTSSRVVSVAMLGVASSKIGKQYECCKCKHVW